MFERDLRSVLEHFDYNRAIKLLNDVNHWEANEDYELSDTEDFLYWEIDTMILQAETNMHNKPKINPSGVWVEIWNE